MRVCLDGRLGGSVAANESPKPQYLIQDLLRCLSQHVNMLANRLGVGKGFRKAIKAARMFKYKLEFKVAS